MSSILTAAFARDLAERVLTTAIYGVIAMLTADATGAISGDPQQWWLVVGLPTVLALLKGVLAGLAGPETGASLLKDPPPKVDDEAGHGDAVPFLVLGFVLAVVVLLLFGVVR